MDGKWSEDHKRIWLQAREDSTDFDEPRQWCPHKAWPEQPEDHEPTEYVRADIATALAEALEELINDPHSASAWAKADAALSQARGGK